MAPAACLDLASLLLSWQVSQDGLEGCPVNPLGVQ